MYNYLETIKSFKDVCAFRFLDADNTFDVSYEQYYRDIRRCAFRLEREMGNLEGRHVGLIGVNSYEYAVIMVALMYSRAVIVPLNYRESEDNIRFAIMNSRLDTLISGDPDKFSAIPGIKCYDFGIALSGEDEQEKDLQDFTPQEADNLMMIVYTSGTTSLAKGVCLSVGNMFKGKKIVVPDIYAEGNNIVPGIMVYTNFPFYHVGGIIALISVNEHGYTLVQSAKPQNLLTDLVNEKIYAAFVIPATVKLWLKSIRKGHTDRLGGVELILTAGAPVSIEDVQEIQSQGITFGQYYGMTETGGIITLNYDMVHHITSVGRSYDNAEIMIIDGEICIRYWGNMLGYYDNEEETKACLKDGMIYTGDLGRLDEDGYLYITGRKKNLIILSGGENVSPEEIEKRLYDCSLIMDCRVFEKEDRIHAAIYCKGEDREAIREYISGLNKTMPIYKRIYGIEFQDEELEKTASGKIRR